MTRKVNRDKRTMSRHYQFETAMSLSGCNADIRVPVKPSEMGQVTLALYNAVTGGGGASAYKNDKLTQAARDLNSQPWRQPGSIGLKRSRSSSTGGSYERSFGQRWQHHQHRMLRATCAKAMMLA